MLNVKWTVFQLYYGENKLHFAEIMMTSAVYWTKMLTFTFIVLIHFNNIPWETCCATQTYYPEKHVVPLIDILPWETCCATQTYYTEKHVPLRHITLRNMLCHSDILPWETCCATLTYYPEKHVVPLRNITSRNMLCYSDILPWFQAKKSLLLFLNAACSEEKQQIPIL